ncbi:MAG: hypothetical protein HY869_04185 [Chloroflexi bacterium]|nr:hypothetical protein [Chloroflexota bacterium]
MELQFRETRALWEGTLEQPALGFRGVENVLASIGEPFQWADGEMLGGNWKAPVGGNRFYLVQLAFTLDPGGKTRVSSAEFCLTLGKQGDKRAMGFDAFPREQTIAIDDSVTLRIGPDFKFGTTDVSLAKADANNNRASKQD